MAEVNVSENNNGFNPSQKTQDALDRLASLETRLFMLSCLDLENNAEQFRVGFCSMMMDLSSEARWVFDEFEKMLERRGVEDEFNLTRHAVAIK